MRVIYKKLVSAVDLSKPNNSGLGMRDVDPVLVSPYVYDVSNSRHMGYHSPIIYGDFCRVEAQNWRDNPYHQGGIYCLSPFFNETVSYFVLDIVEVGQAKPWKNQHCFEWVRAGKVQPPFKRDEGILYRYKDNWRLVAFAPDEKPFDGYEPAFCWKKFKDGAVMFAHP